MLPRIKLFILGQQILRNYPVPPANLKKKINAPPPPLELVTILLRGERIHQVSCLNFSSGKWSSAASVHRQSWFTHESSSFKKGHCPMSLCIISCPALGKITAFSLIDDFFVHPFLFFLAFDWHSSHQSLVFSLVGWLTSFLWSEMSWQFLARCMADLQVAS